MVAKTDANTLPPIHFRGFTLDLRACNPSVNGQIISTISHESLQGPELVIAF